MAALISKGLRRKTELAPAVLLGVDLRDAREEMFVRMVCDGLSLGVAFARAGFSSKDHNAAANLFHLPRVQARAEIILEARRTQGVVTLAEVTDMLKRVFAGAHSEGEYSAAHNAAFSLARLYGHVTDRATLEVIRRPSRDPDAPSEQALASWVQDLPALPAPSPEGPSPAAEPQFLRVSDAPAAPLSAHQGPSPELLNNIKDITPIVVDWTRGPQGPGPELSNDFNGLGNRGTTPGRPENGAPVMAVTGTPNQCGPSELLGTTPLGGSEKGAPLQNGQVPVSIRDEFPPAEELF